MQSTARHTLTHKHSYYIYIVTVLGITRKAVAVAVN